MAHEFGHNFGAEHDGVTGSVCASVSGDFLMSPALNGMEVPFHSAASTRCGP